MKHAMHRQSFTALLLYLQYSAVMAELADKTDSVFPHTTRAELVELADMQDLGSCAERREGSSPSFRSKQCETGLFRFWFCAVFLLYQEIFYAFPDIIKTLITLRLYEDLSRSDSS